MIDCPNSEIRDQLPELLTGALAAPARARIEAHLSTCEACNAELALLRAARRVLGGNAAGVDVARVAARVQPMRYRRSTWTSGQWRIAAGVLIAAIGAGAIGLRHSENVSVIRTPGLAIDAGVQADPISGDSSWGLPSRQVGSGAASSGRDEPELTVATPVAAVLSDERLAALIADIEQIQAVPLIEPQIHPIPVGSGAVLPDSVIRMLDSAAGGR